MLVGDPHDKAAATVICSSPVACEAARDVSCRRNATECDGEGQPAGGGDADEADPALARALATTPAL